MLKKYALILVEGETVPAPELPDFVTEATSAE
jgi:hypothetical protein